MPTRDPIPASGLTPWNCLFAWESRSKKISSRIKQEQRTGKMAGTDTKEFKIVYNPAVPFERKIGTEFGNGRYVQVSGSVPAEAKRFQIDLKNSKTKNIMLHFNPRFKEKKLIANSRNKDVWDNEEYPCANLPFGPGDNFEIEIKNDGNYFSVLCNGKKLCKYDHHQPFGDIDSIAIGGDVNLKRVQC